MQQIFPFAVEGIFADAPEEDWPTHTFITWLELMVRPAAQCPSIDALLHTARGRTGGSGSVGRGGAGSNLDPARTAPLSC